MHKRQTHRYILVDRVDTRKIQKNAVGTDKIRIHFTHSHKSIYNISFIPAIWRKLFDYIKIRICIPIICTSLCHNEKKNDWKRLCSASLGVCVCVRKRGREKCMQCILCTNHRLLVIFVQQKNIWNVPTFRCLSSKICDFNSLVFAFC